MAIIITADVIEQMVQIARHASEAAYCPYSHFPVGAAVLADTGEIFAGCNVENASYGLTTCAERNALAHAIIHQVEQIHAVLLYTPTENPVTPCGACRQVLHELAPTAHLVLTCERGKVQQLRVADLLPQAFQLS